MYLSRVPVPHPVLKKHKIYPLLRGPKKGGAPVPPPKQAPMSFIGWYTHTPPINPIWGFDACGPSQPSSPQPSGSGTSTLEVPFLTQQACALVATPYWSGAQFSLQLPPQAPHRRLLRQGLHQDLSAGAPSIKLIRHPLGSAGYFIHQYSYKSLALFRPESYLEILSAQVTKNSSYNRTAINP